MNAAVSVSRLIPSSPERLFDAWVEPASLSMWMRRTGDGATSVVADVRVGGSFTITMSHRGQDVVHSGTYLVIDRPHTLEFTWRSPATHMQDSVVRVTFVTATRPSCRCAMKTCPMRSQLNNTMTDGLKSSTGPGQRERLWHPRGRRPSRPQLRWLHPHHGSARPCHRAASGLLRGRQVVSGEDVSPSVIVLFS